MSSAPAAAGTATAADLLVVTRLPGATRGTMSPPTSSQLTACTRWPPLAACPSTDAVRRLVDITLTGLQWAD